MQATATRTSRPRRAWTRTRRGGRCPSPCATSTASRFPPCRCLGSRTRSRPCTRRGFRRPRAIWRQGMSYKLLRRKRKHRRRHRLVPRRRAMSTTRPSPLKGCTVRWLATARKCSSHRQGSSTTRCRTCTQRRRLGGAGARAGAAVGAGALTAPLGSTPPS